MRIGFQKRMAIPIAIGICIVGILSAGCAEKKSILQAPVLVPVPAPVIVKAQNIPLIIIGEGGPSRGLFIQAAQTYQKKHGGTIYNVGSGDEFIAAVRNFTKSHKTVSHLEYFGHGNAIGLYVNQEANIHGGLYANDPSLNGSYSAASIYELPETTFQPDATIRFNGCNVAEGYPEKDTLGQRVANYFHVKVIAPKGPTEFSKNPDRVDRIDHANFISANSTLDIYMVPTYKEQGFVEIKPQEQGGTKFTDVHRGEIFDTAVTELTSRGLDLSMQNSNQKKFLPHTLVTYREAQGFCRITTKDQKTCSIPGYKNQDRIRNLHALKMLVDAKLKKKQQNLKPSTPWHKAYISWATTKNILTADFTQKKWYTRGEMAELTWNMMKLQE